MTVPRNRENEGSRRQVRKFNRDVDKGKRTNEADDKHSSRPAPRAPAREDRRWEHGRGHRKGR